MIKNWISSIVIITTLVVGGVSTQHGRVGGLRMKKNLTPSGKTSGSSTRSSTKGDLFSKSQGSSTRSGGTEAKAEKSGSGESDRSGDTEAKSEKSNNSTRSEGGSKSEKSTGSTRSEGSTTKSKTGAHRLFTKTEKTSNGSSLTRSGGGDAKAQKSESGSTRSNGDAKANKTASNRSTNSAKTEKSEIVRL